MSKESRPRHGGFSEAFGAPYRRRPYPPHNNNNSNNNSNFTSNFNSIGSKQVVVPPLASSMPQPQSLQASVNERTENGPRLTINNFTTFQTRLKKLPPDANLSAAAHTQLFQFQDRVYFACAKCRRDNIYSDSVAVDLRNKIIRCTACFTRMIRPRTYRPSRAVPFPSLLSWLNYRPAKVMEMSDDVTSRPAEAVAPSRERMAAPLLANGDQPMNISKLPAIAMHIVRRADGGSRASSLVGKTVGTSGAHGSGGADAGTHPCLRIWGVCQHGEMCLFRNAPADLCLAYLMGLCDGPVVDGAAATTTASPSSTPLRRCTLLHQNIYDLPPLHDPRPAVRYEGDLEDEEGEDWVRWVLRRRNSPNSAEYQLWHNGALEQLFNTYVPALPRPRVAQQPEEKEEEEEEDKRKDASNGEEEVEEEQVVTSVKLNLSDIMCALKGVKKEAS